MILRKKSRGSSTIAKKEGFGYDKSMKITVCEDKTEWKTGEASLGSFEFLQSWEWGEFQANVGHTPIRLTVRDEKVLRGQIQGFEESSGFGIHSLYFPRFSLFGNQDLFPCVIDWVRKSGKTFCRLESAEEYKIEEGKRLSPRQPQSTLLLSLKDSTEEILNQMHSKTRYNIRLAEKKGVSICEEKDENVFWRLMEQTSERDEFRSYEKKYYEKMLNIPFVRQFIAYFEDKPIASIILVQYGKRWTYLHGASSNEYRNVMAPYLLQWKAIEMAKENGAEEYDFWGIAKETEKKENQMQFHTLQWDANDKLSAVTRFKSGFGGTRKNYPLAQEVVFHPFVFSFYQLARKIFRR